MAWISDNTDARLQKCAVVTSDDRYWQPIEYQKRVYGISINGVFIQTAVSMDAYVMRVREKVIEYRGLTEEQAAKVGKESIISGPVVEGASYYFEHYTCRVSRRRANDARGWIVTVSEKWQAFYENGTYKGGAEESVFT